MLEIFNQIQDNLKKINAYLGQSSTKQDQKIDLLRELEIIVALASIELKKHEKNIKEELEFNSFVMFGSYQYFYKMSDRTVFNVEKAKETLLKCDYCLEDFTVLGKSKKLIYEIIEKK